MAGTIGWREFAGDEWQFSNADTSYLPLEGIGDALAACQQDRNVVYFYYVATIRVEEEDDDLSLTSLGWFLEGIPKVQQRWREGALVGPGKLEARRWRASSRCCSSPPSPRCCCMSAPCSSGSNEEISRMPSAWMRSSCTRR